MKRISLLASLVLAACATVPPPAAASTVAGFGQVARAGGLTVRPLELLEDSRCPALVRCIWQGRVRIRAEIRDSAGRHSRELTLGEPLPVDGGMLTLVSVEPPKLAPGETRSAEYRFEFRFER